MANLATNLPVLRTPFLDDKLQITVPWLMFLVQLYQRTGGDQTPPLDLTQIQQQYLSTVNILSSNGFAGNITYTVNNADVTLSTTVTGITKGDGTALSAALSGVDYSLPVLVSSANGFAGTVVNGTSNATVTMKTTITGLLKGNGTAISAAVSGTDYAPATSGTSILYGNGAGGFSNVTIGTNLSFSGGTLNATATSGTSILYGNGSGGFSNVTIGSGVSFVGGTLSASGSGGTVTSVTGTAPIASSGGTTPAISISQATTSTNGYLSSTDWNTFNNKQPSGTYVTSVSATSPVTSSGGTTPTIAIPMATTSVSGYLSSTDWNTFNNKQPSGTYVTSVSGTTGRITSTGGTTPVLDLTSGIATAGTTGSSTLIPVITIDTYGRVTTITTASNPQGTVTSVSGTGTVNGITLTGTVTSSGSLTLGGTLSGIGNSQLTNSTISGVSLGSNLFNLTAGTGVTFSSGTTYNGSTAITINATGSGGTVTSVAATVPSFLSISGSPITTSGTLAISYSGTALPAINGGTAQTAYTTGDILYASATNTLSKLGIGTNGYTLTIASGVPSWKPPYVRTSFTATAGQTSFTATYNVGYVQVFANGVLLNGADYTATSGTAVVLAVAANAGDIVETIAYNV